MCHAVETMHTGKEIACVVYIAATPYTKQNVKYVAQQWNDMVSGIPPSDFKVKDTKKVNTQNERQMAGALDLKILGAQARKVLGEGLVY